MGIWSYVPLARRSTKNAVNPSDQMNVFSPAVKPELSGGTTKVPSMPAEEIISTPKKQPPPESKEGTRVRQLVILSFWAIVIFLGVPIWLWTTSIHRARLPLQEMMDWADAKVCSRCL